MKKSKIDPEALPPGVELATLSRIFRCLRPYRRHSLLVLLIIGAGAVLNLSPAVFIKAIIDTAIPARDLDLLLLFTGGMVLGPLVAGLLGVGQRYLATWIGERVMLDLRVATYERLQAQSIAYFVQARPGEAVSRVLNDVQGVGSVLSSTLVNVFQNVIVLVTTAALIFALDWRLALVAVAALPLFITPTRRVGARRKALKRQAQAKTAELTGLLTETLSVSGATLLKLFARERAEVDRFQGEASALMKLTLEQSLVGRWFNLLLQLFEAIGPALVFLVGGWLVIDGQAPLGTVVAFVTLLRRLYPPASSLAGVRVDLLTSYAYFDRVFHLLDLETEIESPKRPVPLPAVRGKVELRDVTFRYGDNVVLDHLSLTIEPGQRVALVGPSGSGKTTLVALLPRLHDPHEGAVLLDGHDVRTLELGALRRSVAVVTQETFLFNASVLENLRLAKPEATREEIEIAAKAAMVHDLIANLPDGYETIVGDRGHRFSGGERQRLAIARALLADPKVLILDEATNALDSESEVVVQAALDRLRVGRTSISIAHRLSSLRGADRILVLDHGHIIEEGTEAELLAKGGLYAVLHEEQYGEGKVRSLSSARKTH